MNRSEQAGGGSVLAFPAKKGTPGDSLGESSAEEISERLGALIAGDSNAVAWLYDTFSRDLFRRLKGRYGGLPGIDVEDIVHDAIVFYLQRDAKVLQDYLRRTSFAHRSEASLGEALWNLACGLVANRRRSARGRKDDMPLVGTAFPSHTPDPEDSVLSRDELDQLDRCLERRGERLYLYFKLRYEDGLSPREIVQATGWSKKATYKRKQALQEALRDCCTRLGTLWSRWIGRRGAGEEPA